MTALDHPLCPASVLEYRHKDNLAGKVKSLLKHLRADGRIHARFNSRARKLDASAVQSQIFSKFPNKVTNPEFRTHFVASGLNRKLIVADASQVELRRGAACVKISGDDSKPSKTGKDIHRETGGSRFKETARRGQ